MVDGVISVRSRDTVATEVLALEAFLQRLEDEIDMRKA